MGYMNRNSRRPDEWASKSAHSNIIKDPAVVRFLDKCNLPKKASDVSFPSDQLIMYSPVSPQPITHIIAIDGGYSEVPVQLEFPSATIAFFQFGALFFAMEDLEKLEDVAFIDPEDISKLKQIERLKLTLPIKNITLKGEPGVKLSVRKTLYEFFSQTVEEGGLLESLDWFVFEHYNVTLSEWTLARCPICDQSRVVLLRADMSRDYTWSCPHCKGAVYLTDVFRLHEAIDEELGAGGILGYLMTTIEQIILVHLVRIILKQKPGLLGQILFVKDGPLGFFGQTANMHKPMRALVAWLLKKENLFLVGLEKSGAFVEHAAEIATSLKDGTVLLLSNDYIYKYIVPGTADPANPYGGTTYYGNKLIFKTPAGGLHVVTVPTGEIVTDPKPGDLRNLNVILSNVEKLRCDMYDNALVPVALVNKLVSLANHPSSKILQRFAMETLH